jgi:hypothetical protein
MESYISSRHDGPIELMLAFAVAPAFARKVWMICATLASVASSGLCSR